MSTHQPETVMTPSKDERQILLVLTKRRGITCHELSKLSGVKEGEVVTFCIFHDNRKADGWVRISRRPMKASEIYITEAGKKMLE